MITCSMAKATQRRVHRGGRRSVCRRGEHLHLNVIHQQEERSNVLLRQRCVKGKTVAATVRGRQLKRTDYATNEILSDRPRSAPSQLDRWRRCQSGATGLPQALWTSAATLASNHGVGQVARTLRLDYNKLKRQVLPAVQATPLTSASLVELRPPEWLPQVATLCRIELSDAQGAKMTVELPSDPVTVVRVAQAFWRRA